MKKLVFLSLCAAMTIFASCNFGGAEKDKLKAENDSLTVALDQRNAELDHLMIFRKDFVRLMLRKTV